MKYGVTPEWTQELELGEWAMEPSSTASKDIVTKANWEDVAGNIKEEKMTDLLQEAQQEQISGWLLVTGESKRLQDRYWAGLLAVGQQYINVAWGA